MEKLCFIGNVGKDAAQEIFNRDITLEEYLGKAEH